MKLKLGGLLLVMAILAFPGLIFADTLTVSLASVGTASDPNQTNSTGNPTIAIAPNQYWAAALPGSSWVSFGSTGDTSAPGFFVVPNNTSVNFLDSFNLNGAPTGGTLSLMADDSAAVFLNGHQLIAEATTVDNTYSPHCSNFDIGCLSPTTLDLSPYLQTGLNTLEFQVWQRGGSSFGLDYSGSVTDPVATPEPATLLLLSLGLGSLLLGDVLLRRNRSRLSRTA
jgi:PEP-CTERM motif